MNANAHRGRYRKFVGLALASAAAGMVVIAPALGQKPEDGPRDVAVTKVAGAETVVPGGQVKYVISVTNTANAAIPYDKLTVSDPMADADPIRVSTGKDDKALNKDDTWVYEATKTFPVDTALCGTTVQNTAFVVVGKEDVDDKKPKAQSQRKSATARKAAKARKAAQNPAPLVRMASAGVLVQGGTCPAPAPESVVTASPAAPVLALRPAALSIDKTGPTRMLAGGFARFQITVTNTGQTDATGVVLSDLPPRALQWRSVPTGATVSGRSAEWNLGTLAAGQSVTKTVSFRARLSASGRVCNIATVSSAQAGAGVDQACVTVAAARRPATPVTG